VHNANTPATILDAPKLVPVWLVKHTGMSRAQRRHMRFRDGGSRFIKPGSQAPAANVPYVKPRKETA
jgi:hypothetical protein